MVAMLPQLAKQSFAIYLWASPAALPLHKQPASLGRAAALSSELSTSESASFIVETFKLC